MLAGEMGAAGSVRRAAKEEMNQLHEKTLNREEEIEREEGEQWARSEARLHRLLSEKHQLAEELRQTRESLQVQSDGWRRERSKATALMFSELPLNMIQTQSTESTNGPGGGDTPLTKTFPMVTLAQCDIAGFSSLASRLQPHEVVRIIDHFHTLVDQAFSHPGHIPHGTHVQWMCGSLRSSGDWPRATSQWSRVTTVHD
ncbi:hypothetical protein GBAR_LOCUS14460 [Geodia barretti]|uniref:Guanylate cyclase domain-containing protein n=1 Tax=Geodia barretti TaxID=519541 RepID=A0AA35WLM7_GEOBA|nr:hypothetical protein GBAR_LOCUS14460 [Geodia barretti]